MGYTYDVAVAEVDRSYRGVLTATHELGHLLNASHDGEGGARACSATSGYIMSYSWRDATKFNRFSSCSKVSISSFLSDTWYSECLRDASDTSYAYRGQLPGISMSLKDQCLHYNAGVPCSSRSLQSQCQNLCCENILKVSLSSEPAVDGTLCGQDKMCFAGQCVLSSAVSSILPP
ncbi:A disintegrin and metalloproteinase with thrombospondin motifs like [Babylonia areolata]|uniref:A disintegrin and metalloproteinase with thrombospondin motifs like n=1 Tax=Babylonia areolata TaxID=304850 RepID=UPI003FD413A6